MTRIRPYTPDDKDTVMDIWREANALAHPFLPADKVDLAATMIRDTFLDMSETYLVELEGRPVGFIALIENEVGGLFLRPAVQRRGIGRALMDHALSLRDDLTLSVFAENSAARRFYEHCGFQGDTETMNDMFGHPEIRMHYSRG